MTYTINQYVCKYGHHMVTFYQYTTTQYYVCQVKTSGNTIIQTIIMLDMLGDTSRRPMAVDMLIYSCVYIFDSFSIAVTLWQHRTTAG